MEIEIITNLWFVCCVCIKSTVGPKQLNGTWVFESENKWNNEIEVNYRQRIGAHSILFLGVILYILTHENCYKYVTKTPYKKMKHKKKNEKQIKVEMFGKWESFMYTV